MTTKEKILTTHTKISTELTKFFPDRKNGRVVDDDRDWEGEGFLRDCRDQLTVYIVWSEKCIDHIYHDHRTNEIQFYMSVWSGYEIPKEIHMYFSAMERSFQQLFPSYKNLHYMDGDLVVTIGE